MTVIDVHTHMLRKEWFALLRMKGGPREYLTRIWYDAVTYRQGALEMCISVRGEDKVMYGSDWPHNIGDMKGCLGRVNSLPAPAREAVSSSNAERIFRL